MAILGSIIKKSFELHGRIPKFRKEGIKQQQRVLKKLLTKAEFTAFGEHYNFSKILNQKKFIEEFQTTVDTHDYNSMYTKWWHRVRAGEVDVCWPRKIKYFALSSGTSDASSKYIPVSTDMIKTIVKISLRQIMVQSKYDISEEHYLKGILVVGGSTDLKYNGTYYEGDLSGITTGNIPFYVQNYSKPGKEIRRESDWEKKLEEITLNAPKWDIGMVCGVPAWIHILFEKIIKTYNVKTIHDIWPNLKVYIHGGVSFAPYKKGFEKLLGKPLLYFDTYLASEGFIAFQDRQDADGAMKLVLDVGIFFEFVPFTEQNFDADGNMIEKPEVFHIGQVQEGIDYALLISTCSGTWRYLIGDVVRFTSLENHEIIIVGRTKHFLSLCGEHLSQDNMNKAIELVAAEFNIDIKEFTVKGLNYENRFAHKWFIGTNDKVDEQKLIARIDELLKELNDDYRTERIEALTKLFIEVLPTNVFYEYMKIKGKAGSQNKFPRVLKNKQLEDWETYLKEQIQ